MSDTLKSAFNKYADNSNQFQYREQKIEACFYLQSIQERVYRVVGRHPKSSVFHPTKQDNCILNEQ